MVVGVNRYLNLSEVLGLVGIVDERNGARLIRGWVSIWRVVLESRRFRIIITLLGILGGKVNSNIERVCGDFFWF